VPEVKSEGFTQFALAGIHAYAGLLAGVALVVHVLACRYHVLKWRYAR